jgi:hypothetical protein
MSFKYFIFIHPIAEVTTILENHSFWEFLDRWLKYKTNSIVKLKSIPRLVLYENHLLVAIMKLCLLAKAL